jgi:hypothetical protein
MQNQNLRQDSSSELKSKEFYQEEFREIHAIVEDLLTSIEKKGKAKSPAKHRSSKKWKKQPRKTKAMEDLGIRELPFTF